MAFIFPNSWDDDPIWLIFFRGLKLQPPTRNGLNDINGIVFSIVFAGVMIVFADADAKHPHLTTSWLEYQWISTPLERRALRQTGSKHRLHHNVVANKICRLWVKPIWKDVENPWFPQENHLPMVAFPLYHWKGTSPLHFLPWRAMFGLSKNPCYWNMCKKHAQPNTQDQNPMVFEVR